MQLLSVHSQYTDVVKQRLGISYPSNAIALDLAQFHRKNVFTASLSDPRLESREKKVEIRASSIGLLVIRKNEYLTNSYRTIRNLKIHLARENTPHIYSSFCSFQTEKKKIKQITKLFLPLHPNPLYAHLCHLIESAQFALPKCPTQEKRTRKENKYKYTPIQVYRTIAPTY